MGRLGLVRSDPAHPTSPHLDNGVLVEVFPTITRSIRREPSPGDAPMITPARRVVRISTTARSDAPRRTSRAPGNRAAEAAATRPGPDVGGGAPAVHRARVRGDHDGGRRGGGRGRRTGTPLHHRGQACGPDRTARRERGWRRRADGHARPTLGGRGAGRQDRPVGRYRRGPRAGYRALAVLVPEGPRLLVHERAWSPGAGRCGWRTPRSCNCSCGRRIRAEPGCAPSSRRIRPKQDTGVHRSGLTETSTPDGNADPIRTIGDDGAIVALVARTHASWFPDCGPPAGSDLYRARCRAAEVGGAAGGGEPVRGTSRRRDRPAVSDAGRIRRRRRRVLHLPAATVALRHRGLDRCSRTASSVGVALGPNNLPACLAHTETGGGADRIDITVLLGAGEHHRIDAIRRPLTDSTARTTARPIPNRPSRARRPEGPPVSLLGPVHVREPSALGVPDATTLFFPCTEPTSSTRRFTLATPRSGRPRIPDPGEHDPQ
ncbi:hypothetical protein EHYA_02378 [Embleya hyalina]|uniref:Uncharacterized protein n=1 Tax=Embleya hyalina TaxID=516124 RepID=A0A401YJK6_9ACTN|nr:hypothetical protein EHYA_02378 [Embleya hyalina]